jgi:hypothetical protein
MLGEIRRIVAFLVLVAAAWAMPSASARADESRPVTIAVFGDSMSDGLWGGLFRAWHTNPSINVLRRGKNGTGLGHSAKYDWLKGTQTIIAEDKPDIAVITLGLNDRVSLVLEEQHQSVLFGTETWKKTYGERVEALMTQLRQANIPTLWIGPPVMRDADANRDAKMLATIFVERAAKTGVTYQPLWDIAGSGEDYNAFSKDKSGRDRQIRADDGTHFTPLGYDLLAEHLIASLDPLIAAVKAKPKAAPPATSPAHD